MKRVNTSDIVYMNIISDFINNEIEFNQKVNEIALAQKYNVSRTPLREAIKRLEIEGIIIRQTNGRLTMIDLTQENLEELYRVRLALENMLITHASKDKSFIEKLFTNNDQSIKLIKDGRLEEAKTQISQFTNIIYEHITLDITKTLLASYKILVSKMKNNTLSSEKRLKQALQEHIDIQEALANNNIELACKLNENHLQGACQELISQYF